MTTDKNMRHTIIALWTAVAAYLVVIYLPALYDIALSSDLSILTSFAGRMLDGMQFSEAYYETNPPLNIMIYVPVVWLSQATDIPLWHMHFFYSLFWVLFSFTLTALILRKNTFLESHWKHLLLICFLMTAIMTPSKSFGDRDHLVYLGLVPFILAQLDMMGSKNLPHWLRVPVLVFGALTILIKPHYGILPTVLLLWRIYKQRNFHFLLQGDFLALSIGVLSYAALLWFVFPDFLSVVLPDTIRLYAINPHAMVKYETAAYVLLLFLCWVAVTEFKLEGKQKQLCLFLCFCSAVLIIPYFVQGKGLLYHRICFVSFFYSAVAFIAYFSLQKHFPRIFKPHIAPGIVLLVMMVLCTTFTGLPSKTVTDEEFRSYPISQKLEEHCPQPCSFLMLYDYSDIIHQLQVYNGAFHASRFTSLWFLPLILSSEHQIEKGETPDLSVEDIAHYKDKYLTMVGADMERFRPDIIFDFKDYEVWGDRKFDFIAYLSQDPRFAEAMQHYEKVDSFTLKRNMYYQGYSTPFDEEGPVRFDIYKRMQ